MIDRKSFLAACLLVALPATSGAADVDASVLKAEADRIAAIAEATKSAVSVFVPSGAGGGSGVVIDPEGFALTNFHVSSPAGAYMVCGMADGNLYDTVIVGIDPVGDLALVKLLGRSDFSAAELGNSDRVQQGDWCMVIGNPFLLANDLQPTVTWGLISGVHRYQYPSGTLLEYADCLQTDASINPGNSGGPLYAADSKLIGIVGRASFEKRGRVNVGVGYAISINQAKNFLGYLHSGRIVDHATLGATVATDEGKVIVSNILENSDAYRRGLRYGAEILAVNGRDVASANDLQNVLGTLPKGWRVPISFRHEGRNVDTIVRLAGVHGRDELLEKMAASMPPPPPRPKQKEGDAEKDQIAAANAHDAELPASVEAVYEAKHGYANYYFNRLHQQRLWESLKKHSPDASGSWTIEGPTDNDGPVLELTLGKQVSIATDGGQPTLLDPTALYDGIDSQQLPAFAACLDAWHRMVELGPDRFGEVYYLGTMPLRGEYPLRDVLVGTSGELESWFYFDPESGRLEAVECWADRFRDPAELLIEAGDNNQPVGLSLYFGERRAWRMQVEQWKASANEQ
ncbi:Putative serine protease HhoA precursor [Rosistilla oblonga]|uniref:S1C family serine protease n=1 Tax=Rosistilla oblonga TaxID=2527990 RepID=UPI00118ACF60|nr:trypsin-like peptidase domain-containing protein [Rosistilla oblonga]QDV10880.1 Putative serine protease HhoA precursor [Rosistilla oblonga]